MQCPNCSYINPANQLVCKNCEISLTAKTIPAPIATPVEPLIYASLLSRLLAAFLDMLVILTGVLALLFVVAILVAVTGNDAILHDERVMSYFFGVIACSTPIYFILMESGSRQATFGKQWLNLAVQDTTGNPLTYMRAVLRLLMRLISILPAFIGLLIQPFTPRKQTLHDLIVRSIVVRTTQSKKVSIMAPLMVLFIALMIPTLALIATAGRPLFNQYLQQVQMSKALKIGKSASTIVSNFYNAKGHVPVSLEEADGKKHTSPLISEININQQNGEITLTFSALARKDIRGKHLLFKPSVAANKNINWTCYSLDIETRFLPETCR